MTIALVLAASAPLHAAPFCHDLKGLYTPCPSGPARRQPHRRAPEIAGGAPVQATPPPDAMAVATHPAVRPRPASIARTRLCHDLKGLYTPCPR